MRQLRKPKSGDYVLCCKYKDHRREDQWQVGFIDRVETVDGVPLFVMREKQRSYFKVCFAITPEEGGLIIDENNPGAARLNGHPKLVYNVNRWVPTVYSKKI